MPDRQVILVGGFSEIIELCEEARLEIVGIFDNSLPPEYAGYSLLGPDSAAPQVSRAYRSVPLIISPDSPATRRKLVGFYSELGFSFGSLVHPGAHISRTAEVGKGAVIQHGVNISANARLGAFVKLNTNANVMHDAHVGSYSTVAPNAVLLGRVTIEEAAYIGSNATILPGLCVGRNSVVGAGAVVTKSVATGKVVAGNPARELIPKNR